MFSFKREKITDGRTMVSVTVSDTDNVLGTYLEKQMLSELTKEMTKAWIEEHGASLLEKISPEEVEKAIKTAVAKKVLGD